MKTTTRKLILIFTTIFIFFGQIIQAKSDSGIRNDSLLQMDFIKTEINSGFIFFRKNSRESLNTDQSEYSEERHNYSANYFFGINSWAFKEESQKEFRFISGIGPVFGNGTSLKSNEKIINNFEDKFSGIGLFSDILYSGRFYFDKKNYTLIQVRGFGKFEKIKNHSKGTSIPSDGSFVAPFPIDEKLIDNRLRYGVEARAGWGAGKMFPTNYFMLAEYILKTYYPGQLFSEPEIKHLAAIISRVKNLRSVKTGHSEESEINQFIENSRKELLFKIPQEVSQIWGFGEFSPRLEGTRVEAGPFFSYNNREPDFIYGGYLKFEKNKYCNQTINLSLISELSYNHYKKRDWLKLEAGFIIDLFKNLRSRYTFGLHYIPILEVNDFKSLENIRHLFQPSLKYYSQINSKLRLGLTFLYRVTNNNDFFMNGPEFTLSFYKSRY